MISTKTKALLLSTALVSVASVASAAVNYNTDDATETTGVITDADSTDATIIDSVVVDANNVTVNVTGNITNNDVTAGSDGIQVNATATTATNINIAADITSNDGGTPLSINAAASAGSTTIDITSAATLTGGVTTGAGTDAFTSTAGANILTGDLDLGNGADTLTVTADSLQVTGDISNVETINVNGGTLNADGNITGVTTATVADGATLDMAAGNAITATDLNIDGTLATAGTVTVNSNVTASASATIGDITLGAAGHTVTTTGAGFGAVTGGAGTDTFNSTGATTTGNLGAIENINVNSGSLALTGTLAGVTELNVADAASMTVSSTAGAASITVAKGGNLEITGASTITGNVVANGTYTQTGASTIAGDLTVGGTYTDAAGTAVTGNLVVDTSATASLGGTSSAATLNVGNEAVLNVLAGTTTVAGAATVTGDVNVSTGATLDVDGAISDASIGKVNLTIAAGAHGTLDVAQDMTGKLANITTAAGTDLSTLDGQTYSDIIIGTGDISNSTVTTGNALYTYTWQGDNTGNYDLTIALKDASVTTLEGAATGTANKAIAAIFDSATGSSSTVITELYSNVLAQSDTNGALESITPDLSGVAAASVNVATGSAGSVSNRLASLRGSETGMAAGHHMANSALWIQGFGSKADQDEREGVSGFDATTAGLSLGFDTEALVEGVKTGVAISYAQADVDSDRANSTESEITSYGLTFYGSKDLANDIYVDAMAGYAWNENEGTRTDFLNDTYTSEFDSTQWNVKIEAGKAYAMENYTVTPRVGVQYVSIDADSYTEQGSGANGLSVEQDEVAAFIANIGADVAWNIAANNGTVYKPYVSADLSYDFEGEEVVATSTFKGDTATSFKSTGAEVAQTTLGLGFGTEIITTAGFDFTVGYDAQVKEDFVSHAGQVKAKWNF